MKAPGTATDDEIHAFSAALGISLGPFVDVTGAVDNNPNQVRTAEVTDRLGRPKALAEYEFLAKRSIRRIRMEGGRERGKAQSVTNTPRAQPGNGRR